jgi:hypothetical protein
MRSFSTVRLIGFIHGETTTRWISHSVDCGRYCFPGAGVAESGFGLVAIFLMLVGIVKKNAIMMVDFALQAQRTEGKDPETAIYEACLLRFRPIMMTTFAALAGSLPIALASLPLAQSAEAEK